MELTKIKKLSIEIFLILGASLFFYILLYKLFFREPKLLQVFILGVMGSVFLLIISNREVFLLCLCAFILPYVINVNLFYHEVSYQRPLYGFAISAFDVIFFALFVSWIYRLSLRPLEKIYLVPNVTIPFFFIAVFTCIGLHYSSALPVIKVSAMWELFKKWLIVIYLANNLNNNNKTISLVIGFLLLAGLFQAFIGTGQYIKGGPLGLGMLGETYDELYLNVEGGIRRSAGTLGQPNQLALFLGLILQLNLSYFFSKLPYDSKWYLRWIYVTPFIPMLFTLFISYSRSGWFSFLTAGAINASWCLILCTRKKFFSIIIVFGFFITFAGMAFVLSESIRNRILLDDKGASEVRKPLEEIAKNIICDNPWFGVGLTDYQAVVYQYDNTQSWVSSEIFFETVHNEPLLVAAEQGIPVLLLLIYLIAWILFTLWRISRTSVDPFLPYMAIGFFSGLISWMIHTQKDYNYVFLTTRFWFYIGIICAMKYLIEEKEKNIATIQSC